jgi:hypothetical protein
MPRIDPIVIAAMGGGVCFFLICLVVGGAAIVWFMKRKSGPGHGIAASGVSASGRQTAKPKPKPKADAFPAWESKSRILAIETQGAQLTGLVYTGVSRDEGSRRVHQVSPGQQVTTIAEGDAVLRRHDFDDGIAWERSFPDKEDFEKGRYGRSGDIVVFPRMGGGVVGLDPLTGAERWSLSHEAGLHIAPHGFSDGSVLLVFQDKTWIRLDPVTGSRQEHGTVSSEKEVESKVKRGWPLSGSEVAYEIYVGHPKKGGIELYISDDELSPGSSNKGKMSVAAKRHDMVLFESETWPESTVPIEGWEADGDGIRVGDHIGLLLHNDFGETSKMALGLFVPATFALERTVEIGTGPSDPDLDSAYYVDGHLVFVADSLPMDDDPPADNPDFDTPFFRKHDVAYIFDSSTHHVIGRFPKSGHFARLYQGSAVTWKGKL